MKKSVTAFKGTFAVRSKIAIDSQVSQQVSHMNYLWSNLTYTIDKHKGH